MALIRVTRLYEGAPTKVEGEIILNISQILLAYPDGDHRGSWVRFAQGELVLVKLSFDELWTLIQRET